MEKKVTVLTFIFSFRVSMFFKMSFKIRLVITSVFTKVTDVFSGGNFGAPLKFKIFFICFIGLIGS